MRIDIQGMTSLILGATTVLNAIALFYVAKVKLDEIEARLPRAKIVVDAKRQWGSDSMPARMYRLSMILIALAFSKHWSKRGLVDLKEINELPKSLACWVLVTGISSLLVLLGLYFSTVEF